MELETFLAKWLGRKGGAERANFPPFIGELCDVLGVPRPDVSEAGVLGDYGFEAPVPGGRIDLYRRGKFILEAKQSRLKEGELAPDPVAPPAATEYDLFGNPLPARAAGGSPLPAYDRLMRDARAQAERYAIALPAAHGWPPFLIVLDVGRAFELFFDWAGNGKGYGFFPDQASYRIPLDALRNAATRELIRGIWTDPASVDPRRRAAEVTREIAGRLASVSKQLEADTRATNLGQDEWSVAMGIEETALFLMRTLFCMFAEDVGLLPEGKFAGFLEDARDKSEQYWVTGLTDLWSRMNSRDARYWAFGDTVVRYFNGNLFSAARVYPLPREQIGELLAAARCDWRKVEPAIFGTLLEQALTAGERAKLGAHYTPRPYVERLVQATVMDVLTPEWDAVRTAVRALADAGDPAAAVEAARAFHVRLAATRVLDPACGTGNFLYVAMDNLLRLESEVLRLLAELGADDRPRIDPNTFLGLELNPRAAVIAELVLWIGWLRFRLANTPGAVTDPVLPPLTAINFGRHGGYDALLARDDRTVPVDPPTPAAWPEAEFIVGNPPFIGKGSAMREALGDDYVNAVWSAAPNIPKSADFVMQWWDRAAAILLGPGTTLRRFGFVTTNSITQVFSRRVVAARLAPLPPAVIAAPDNPPQLAGEGDHAQHGGGARLSLVMAIADHPWTRVTKDAAAVRIAMTVAEVGARDGRSIEITSEARLDTDTPELGERATVGRINADLSIGTDVTRVAPLAANAGLSCNGMMLAGQGFKIAAVEAERLIRADGEAARAVIRPYVGGGELLNRPQHRFVIDLFGRDEAAARRDLPATYTHLLEAVLPERRENRRQAFRQRWWLFGEPRRTFRPALASLGRYIATTETAKHRVFQFVAEATVPDHMVIAIATAEAWHLGVLSSRFHTDWAPVLGGWLGFGNDPRYSKSLVFDPFPFPDATPAQAAAIGAVAEELDATRKAALAENPDLTMTELYNLRAKRRAGATMSLPEQDRAARGRAGIIAKLHDDLDALVAAAYGWPTDLPAPEVVARLVALNAERTAEEAAGHVRWLRPEYQRARYGETVVPAPPARAGTPP